MPIPTVNGKYLFDIMQAQLGGYANAIDPKEAMPLLSEGKNEVWAVLKEVREDYFVRSSQNTNATADDYFAKLTTTSREFTLPKDFHQLKFFEVLDGGFQEVEFVHRDLASEEFKDARRAATAQGSTSPRSSYLYDIIGKRTLMLAQYPERAFELKCWYVRSLPDIDISQIIDEILFPYVNAIATYATKLVMLSLQDNQMSKQWHDTWREKVRSLEAAAGQRDITGIKVVQDFQGWPMD